MIAEPDHADATLSQRRPGTVTLAPLPRPATADVLGLALADGQESYVGAIADMVGETRASVDLHVIRAGGEAVGFFKIDRAYGEDSALAAPDDAGLRGMLIGAQYQGRGYGRAALAALPDYLRRTYPGLDRIRLTVNERNAVARDLYLSSDWRDTGEMWHGGRAGPRHILEMTL